MKKYIIGLVFLSVTILAGCSFGSPVESQLSGILAKMSSAEEAYRDAQSELNDLEKSEQALFNETMDLTQDQEKELKSKVAELEALLEKRLVHIEKEEASIKIAKKSVTSIDELVAKVEGGSKNRLDELRQTISERYELHSTMVEEYKKLTSLQKELYEMLVKEGTKLPALQEKVEEVNAQNETVRSIIGSFNEATDKINDLKDEVYSQLEKE